MVNPSTISASETLKFSTRIYPCVPPTVIFPVTLRLLLTCKSFPIVTFPPINGFGANEIMGVEPSPVPPVTSISFAVPEIDST